MENLEADLAYLDHISLLYQEVGWGRRSGTEHFEKGDGRSCEIVSILLMNDDLGFRPLHHLFVAHDMVNMAMGINNILNLQP